MHIQNKKYGNFVSISRLTGKCEGQKLNNFCSSSLVYTNILQQQIKYITQEVYIKSPVYVGFSIRIFDRLFG